MNADPLQANTLSRYPKVDVQKRLALAYVLGLIFLYLFIKVHTPLAIYAGAPHDDTLFLVLGQRLALGNWLGPYNEFTLVKGPGYPAFLALGHWLGLPASLTTGLFHCLAVTAFAAACQCFLRSYLLSGALFTLLLWHPASLTPPLLRIIRDSIYYAEGLLFLAALVGALFCAKTGRQRYALALFAGAVFGWFWLTREEGIWILPGVAVLFAAAALYALRERRLFQVASVLLIFGTVFVAENVAFRSINLWRYGKFVGVDFLEKNYQRALRAIHSVRSGEVQHYISATRKTQKLLYEISPTLATLRPYFDAQSTEAGWAAFTCGQYPASCGEVAVGWFIFALRDAASKIGQYESPQKASAFFGKMADEIEAACQSGKLECHPQLVAEMPPLNWHQILSGLPRAYRDGIRLALNRSPPLVFQPSAGNEEQLAPYLFFLNYPRYSLSPSTPTEDYMLSGWYYRGSSGWFSLAVTAPTNYSAPVSVTRNASPDLLQALKSPDAAQQRFALRTRCNDECILQVKADDGTVGEKRIGDLRNHPTGFKVGQGDFTIDGATIAPTAVGFVHLVDRVANTMRRIVVRWYEFVFLPILAVGAVAFLYASIRYWRAALWNLCYVVALTSWVLVFMRVTLLVAMELTSATTVINSLYGAPIFFHLVCAAVLSIAAWVQLAQGRTNAKALPIGGTR